MQTEEEALLRFLDSQRNSVLRIVAGLSDEMLRRPVLPSGWTCLGLVKHLAVDVERYWIRAVAAGEPITFSTTDENDLGWVVSPSVAAETVFDLYRNEVEKANAIIRATPLDAPPKWHDEVWEEWGTQVPNLRWIMLHLIEETARHAGHLDAARELLDGRTGL
jgi:uncharacterized damage-inducible protein DinB